MKNTLKSSKLTIKERPLTDEERALPGPKPSKAQLEAWLRPDENEEERPLSEAIADIKKRLLARAARKA